MEREPYYREPSLELSSQRLIGGLKMVASFAKHLGTPIDQADTSPQHHLGKRICAVYGANQDKYAELIYIKAAAALTTGLVCELPLISGTDAYQVDTSLTKTNAATLADAQFERFSACVPVATLAINEYGWAFVKGTFNVTSAGAFTAGDVLAVSATAGKVDDTDNDYELYGCRALATASGADELIDIYCPFDLTIYRNAA